MAEIQLRFGTDEYKNAKAELQGYQTQLGSLTSQLQPCTLNRNLQLQEYEEAVDYDDLYTAASENLSAAEGELRQLDEDVSKIEQSTERKNGKIISFTKSDGTKIKNDNDAASEYNHQLEIIIQKRSAINTKVEQARQEQLRITQERNSKQLKETQIEKQESDTAQQELDDLNTEINELNAKISPLETAIKKADEDTVDVAAQNNEDWTFYAKKELEAEGVKNPSKKQIQARAEEIKQRNIELGNCNKKGELIVGKTIVTLTGRNGGVADDMVSAEEAVSQYKSAISKSASQAIETALGQLSPEEKAAYNSLPADKKSAIQSQVLASINKGKGDNALSLIKQAVSSAVAASNASQNTENSSGIVLPFTISVEHTMYSSFYTKTADGNYRKGDKLYKASGDMASGKVTVTEIGNAPVQHLTQEQQNISQSLDACRKAAMAALRNAENVLKYASSTGMLNGLMYAEYHNLAQKWGDFPSEIRNVLGGSYDTPNIVNEIKRVNRLTSELNSLSEAYKAKDKGMSDSYYNVTGNVGAIPGKVGLVGNAYTAMGQTFDAINSEEGLTLPKAGQIILDFAYNQFGGEVLNKMPYAQKIVKTVCGNSVTKAKIFEYLKNVGLGELKSALGL